MMRGRANPRDEEAFALLKRFESFVVENGGSGEMERYLFLPPTAVRWAIPDSAAATAPLGGWRPYDLFPRLAWGSLRYGVRFAGVRRMLWSKTSGPSTLSLAGIGAPGEFQPAIYIGTPSRARKAIVILTSRLSGRPEFVLKLGISAGAKEAIDREHVALTSERQRLSTLAPEPVWVKPGEGAALQKFLGGDPMGSTLEDAHFDFLERLRNTVALDAKRISDEVWTELDPAVWERIGAEPRFTSAISSVIEHGDFSPWNLRRTAEGIAAVDWEDMNGHGLPLYDLAHFFMMNAFVFKRKLPHHWWTTVAVRAHAEQMGVADRDLKALVRLVTAKHFLKWKAEGVPELAEFVLRHVEEMQP